MDNSTNFNAGNLHRDFPVLETDRQYEALDYLKGIEAAPANVWNVYTLVYFGTWSTFEEHGSLLILQKDDQYFSLEGGHCVMAEDNRDETWSDLNPISEADAILAAKELEESIAETSQYNYC